MIPINILYNAYLYLHFGGLFIGILIYFYYAVWKQLETVHVEASNQQYHIPTCVIPFCVCSFSSFFVLILFVVYVKSFLPIQMIRACFLWRYHRSVCKEYYQRHPTAFTSTETDCAVCMESNDVRLECGHNVHRKCLNKPVCPICRAPQYVSYPACLYAIRNIQ
jgi:hypothetical protein